MSDEQGRTGGVRVLTELPRPPKKPWWKKVTTVLGVYVFLIFFYGGVEVLAKTMLIFMPWLGKISMVIALIVIAYPSYLLLRSYDKRKKEDERTILRYRWELQRLTQAACDTIEYGDYPNLDPLISALNEIRELEDPET